MCYRYSFILIIASALLLVSIRAAPASDVVVEKQDSLSGETPVDVPEDCHQPKETGRCFALFYRYAYNVDTQACEEFVYGGCAGNRNNFESKELCEQSCLGRAAVTEIISVTTEQSSSDSEVTTESSISSSSSISTSTSSA
ncbi:tissue factor pathway inhibitor [Drosophila obscura]|uniref:tissue factor pathway inhibitor n=1 Tax=Drosophila obscura TaxID=7282 RepID=UPI000BA05351|nr:tissue factor pathway inhibitor [Drosophila obscura]